MFPDGDWMYCDKWNPLDNIEQAMKLWSEATLATLEKTDVDGEEIYISYWEDFAIPCSATAEHDTPEGAVSLACARASGWEDD
jgi:hypothetical protein